jgi:hypothetical protein
MVIEIEGVGFEMQVLSVNLLHSVILKIQVFPKERVNHLRVLF